MSETFTIFTISKCHKWGMEGGSASRFGQCHQIFRFFFSEGVPYLNPTETFPLLGNLRILIASPSNVTDRSDRKGLKGLRWLRGFMLVKG